MSCVSGGMSHGHLVPRFPHLYNRNHTVFFCLPKLFDSWTVMPICFNKQAVKICIYEVKECKKRSKGHFHILPGFSTCLLKEGEILLELRLQNKLSFVIRHQQTQPGRSKRKPAFLRITVRELLNSLKRGVNELTLDLLSLLFLNVGSQKRRVHRIFRVLRKQRLMSVWILCCCLLDAQWKLMRLTGNIYYPTPLAVYTCSGSGKNHA